MQYKSKFSRVAFIFSFILILLLIAGCNADSADDGAVDHDATLRHFVPNDGAEVRITSPITGDAYESGASVPVTIETTDFIIGKNGNHWHIYLDGMPIMVMGGETYVLENLEPGEHEIDVYLSLGTHEDLEDGKKITIMVEE